MGIASIARVIGKRKVFATLFYFGEESYLVDESLSLIRSKSISQDLGGLEDFNSDSFEVPFDDIYKMKDVVLTLPMMASQRLVICKGVEKLKEREWEALTSLIESPVRSCIFVLVAHKVDKRKKYFKLLNRHAICVELKVPYDNQIPSWIDYIVTSEGLEVSREARSLIHQLVGTSLSELRNEVIKLKSYLGGRLKIDGEDVLQVVSKSRVHSIFDLTDAIGRKSIPEALKKLAEILRRGESEVATQSLILRHFRILNLLRRGQREGLVGPSLSAFVGVPSFFLKQYQKQLNLWGENQIRKVVEMLHKTDRALKSSSVSSQIWLENFIVKSCQRMS